MVLVEQLISYAHYHRDPRNIATHLLGIPMIVLAVSVLLAQPVRHLGDLYLTPAWVLITVVCAAYYFPMGWRVGLTMATLLSLSNLVGHELAQREGGVWLWGVGLFVLGWTLQFLGHKWEGRKPAFVDDLRGLLQGPLFVVCELAFKLGLLKDLQSEIELACGPVRRDPHASPATPAH